jgi:hypothetical protein
MRRRGPADLAPDPSIPWAISVRGFVVQLYLLHNRKINAGPCWLPRGPEAVPKIDGRL